MFKSCNVSALALLIAFFFAGAYAQQKENPNPTPAPAATASSSGYVLPQESTPAAPSASEVKTPAPATPVVESKNEKASNTSSEQDVNGFELKLDSVINVLKAAVKDGLKSPEGKILGSYELVVTAKYKKISKNVKTKADLGIDTLQHEAFYKSSSTKDTGEILLFANCIVVGGLTKIIFSTAEDKAHTGSAESPAATSYFYEKAIGKTKSAGKKSKK